MTDLPEGLINFSQRIIVENLPLRRFLSKTLLENFIKILFCLWPSSSPSPFGFLFMSPFVTLLSKIFICYFSFYSKISFKMSYYNFVALDQGGSSISYFESFAELFKLCA